MSAIPLARPLPLLTALLSVALYCGLARENRGQLPVFPLAVTEQPGPSCYAGK